MTIAKKLKAFIASEDGAVTVDWVVLTAAACFFSVALVGSIQSAATDKANGIGAAVVSQGTASLE